MDRGAGRLGCLESEDEDALGYGLGGRARRLQEEEFRAHEMAPSAKEKMKAGAAYARQAKDGQARSAMGN